MAHPGDVEVKVEGDSVLVSHPALLQDRSARLFFASILGGTETPTGWNCPRRQVSLDALVVRINTFLENKGWTVQRSGIADRAVELEIERRRSFKRAVESATSFRQGTTDVDLAKVTSLLAGFGWQAKNRHLYPYQEQALLHGIAVVNAANFSVPGSGKTASTLALAAIHLASNTIDVIVVVGPLACFAPWEKEVRAAIALRIKPKRVRGTTTERRRAYARAQNGELLLVSYATAAADRAALVELFKSKRVMLIADESHRVKRFRGGLWAPSLIEVAKHARVRHILSGTPMPQSGKDLFSQLRILWPAGELTGPRDDFAVRVEKHFDSVLADIQPFISRTPKAALNLRPYKIFHHTVDMVGTQAEIYDLVENKLRRSLPEGATWKEKLDRLRRNRPLRLLQAATNPDLLNQSDRYFGIPRIDAPSPSLMERLATYRTIETPAKSTIALTLIESIRARDQKVVCWSNFVPNLDQFSELVRTKLNLPCYQIDGRIATARETLYEEESEIQTVEDAETRERIIERFLASVGPAVLVTNPASCSESISLHRTCHNAIYLDRTYDCALFLQSIDRIHRLGLPPDANVEIHILQSTMDHRPTIDHLVDLSIARKETQMRQLLEGAALRPVALAEDPLREAEGDEEDLAELLRYLLGEE